MSTLGAAVLTLADWAKRLDPDGKTATIVELLNQTNEVLLDMNWMESNQATSHRITVRTGLPAVAWRLLNAGVTPSKSTTAQIDEAMGMLEAWSEVDKDLALLNGNTGVFRLSEGRAFIEAMNEQMVATLFYGNSSTSPEQFTGLAPRYSSLSATNASHTISAGGSGSDNSSIWLVCWSDQTISGIYPKGSKAGLIHEDEGEVTVETATGIGGGRMKAFRDHWQWKCGIALKDWRYVVRICNIDISNLTTESSDADLTKYMIRAVHRIPNIRFARPVFYMNRTCFEMLDIQRRRDVKAGGQLHYMEVDGVMTATFRGIPVRLVDQLLETEATVS